MKFARFQCDDGLRILLPRDKASGVFDIGFNGPQSCKHLIESLGIPHTEIGSIFANERPVGTGYLVKNGDTITVSSSASDSAALGEPKFVLDGHLGRLNSRLRMLGFDCTYQNDYVDRELVRVSIEEGRILLTSDRRLLMHKFITAGYLIRSLEPQTQIREVVHRFQLRAWIRPFQRCIRCNHLLQAVEKEDIVDRLEPLTRIYFNEFHICPACRQIYWKGSHFDKMQRLISAL